MWQSLELLVLLAEANSKPLFQRLGAEDRIRVLLGFAAIVGLGGLLVLLTLMGGRITKQFQRRKSTKEPKEKSWEKIHDDWAAKPIIAPDDNLDS